jgi:predicted Zn-dependent peptidase
MVNFDRFVLDNGLRVIIHEDTTTPLVAVNLLYDVGARDEHPDQTGFAHLFEHLMFEGSVNIPDYDKALQMAGGENNAFTNNDITNYYLTLPAQNLETALWLESDRMLGLAFSEEKLGIQKNVVTEEFRQNYLNQPYGDIWLLLRPLIYKVHPYQWSTIGKSIEHVQNADLNMVVNFFNKFYKPANAILVISGNVKTFKALDLVKKWFGEIPSTQKLKRDLPKEPKQTQHRKLAVKRDVPFDEIYLAFHTSGRSDSNFYTTDIITDILAGGQSGRLREKLLKKKKIFTEINAWVSGSIDMGFLAVSGKLHKHYTMENAREAIWEELELLAKKPIDQQEFQKIKNKLEASQTYAEVGILSKAMNLAYYELLGNVELLNHQMEKYFSQTIEQVREESEKLFSLEKASELNYLSNNN